MVDNQIFLAARTDGMAGSGTQPDPYDVSSSTKLDLFFANRQSSYGTTFDPAIFIFAPGNYTTLAGIVPTPGWQIVGSGENVTVLALDTASTNGITGYGSAIIAQTNPSHDILVQDITLNGNVLSTGSLVTTPFNTPGSGASQVVSVTNGALFSVNENVYVQDTLLTGGINQWYGMFQVTSIVGNNVTIENTGSFGSSNPGVVGAAVGSSVPTSAALIKAQTRLGIYIAASTNVRIRNVTVTNVSVPYYEGPLGICLSHSGSVNGSSNSIERCTVGGYGTGCNLFGAFGWNLSVVDQTYGTYPNASSQCDIIHCVVNGNGWYQGVGIAQVGYSKFVDNTISNIQSGFYHDTGVFKNCLIEGNTITLSTVSSGYACFTTNCGGSYLATLNLIQGNLFTTSTGSSCVLINGNSSEFKITENYFLGSGTGVTSTPSTGYGGHSFTINSFGTAIANISNVNSIYGSDQNNFDIEGNPIKIGSNWLNNGSSLVLSVSQSAGPIKTLVAAQSAAAALVGAGAASVTIVVLDGTFNEKNLGANNVNWIFYPGASIVITGAINTDTIFSAASGIAYSVSGSGQVFSITSTSGGVHAIYLNGGGNVTFSNLTFKVVGASTGPSGPYATSGILLSPSTTALSLNCNSVHLNISDTTSTGGAYGIYNENTTSEVIAVIGSGNITIASSNGAVGLYTDLGGSSGATVNWSGTANMSVSASGQYLVSARNGTTSFTWNGPINVVAGTFASIIYINSAAVSFIFNGPINYSSSGTLCSTRTSGATLIFGSPVRLYSSTAMVGGVVTVSSQAIDTGKLVCPVHRGTNLTNPGVLGVIALSFGSVRAKSTNSADTDYVDFLLMT